MKITSRPRLALLALAGVGLLAASGLRLRACGPWLPELILTKRQAVLRTPVGDFGDEVMALTEADGAPAMPSGTVRVLRSASHPATGEPPPDANAEVTDPDLAQLRDALEKRGVPTDRRENILVAYQTFRGELNKTAAAIQQAPSNPDEENHFRFDERAATLRGGSPPPAAAGEILPPALAEGLPPEWADYLEGAYQFWHDDLPRARAAWERLLARPREERLHLSVRAAYMLARVLQDPAAPPGENAKRYQRVRALVADGCLDPQRLASDSLGWEARLALDAKNGVEALRLYYLQASTGGNNRDWDDTSLRRATDLVCTQAAADPAVLAAAAGDPFVRRVVTLQVACHRYYDDDSAQAVSAPTPKPGTERSVSDDEKKTAKFETDWLAALTRVGVDNVREAPGLAWAAYEKADFPQAAAWLEKAPADHGLACWLRAKLALRDGKLDAAAGFFARAVRSYPVEAKDFGGIPAEEMLVDDATAFRSKQFQLDSGIVALARNDYAQALTALLRSGYWSDAAYVAERVMTTDELLAYVRANYPDAPARKPDPNAKPAEDTPAPSTPPQLILGEGKLSGETSTQPVAFSVRYLLARRLGRDNHAEEAREFYPPVLRPKYDEYVAAMKLSNAPGQPKAKRADALWRAAQVRRYLGMELFGTENDPDWAVYDGSYEGPSYRLTRLEKPAPRKPDDPAPEPQPPFVPPVSNGEKRRVEKEQAHPEKRYHYRYEAAELAWRAAALMPDQQEATARVLATGGLWLESVDQTKMADRFYLAILRRCGRTNLGREANKLGHFPDVPP